MPSKVIDANKKVHSILVTSGEYARSPHQKHENKERVSKKLALLCNSDTVIRHLDVGCGDGFIFDCRPMRWSSMGIDVTNEMLEACKRKHPDIALQMGEAESLPFDNETFDVVTCYSFLDHLENSALFYQEAYRVLRPGGKVYFGLNPNRKFAELCVYDL